MTILSTTPKNLEIYAKDSDSHETVPHTICSRQPTASLGSLFPSHFRPNSITTSGGKRNIYHYHITDKVQEMAENCN